MEVNHGPAYSKRAIHVYACSGIPKLGYVFVYNMFRATLIHKGLQLTIQ